MLVQGLLIPKIHFRTLSNTYYKATVIIWIKYTHNTNIRHLTAFALLHYNMNMHVSHSCLQHLNGQHEGVSDITKMRKPLY